MARNIVKFDDMEAEVDNVDGRLIAVRPRKRSKNKSYVALIDPVTLDIINPITGDPIPTESINEPELAITASRNALSTDIGNIITNNTTSNYVYTITTAFQPPAGYVQSFYQANTGSLTVAAGAGVTLEGAAPIAAPDTHYSLRYRGSNVWAWKVEGSPVDLTGAQDGNVVVVNSTGGLTTVPLVGPLFNFNPDNYPKTRAILAAIQAGFRAPITGDIGTPNLDIFYIRFTGINQIPPSNNTTFDTSPAFVLANVLTRLGIPASSESWIGSHDFTDSVIANIDTRCVFSADWVRTPASGTTMGKSLGGRAYVSTAATQGNMTFTPSVTTDTLVVLYEDEATGTQDLPRAFGGATGATLATVVSRPAYTNNNKLKRAVFTSPATSVWNISKLTANTNRLAIQGIYAYNSSQVRANILDCYQTFGVHQGDGNGIFNFTVNDGLSRLGTIIYGDASGTGAGTATTLGASSLVIVETGNREGSNSGTSANPTFITNYTTKLNAGILELKNAGAEVVLVYEPQQDATLVNQQALYNAAVQAAKTHGVTLVDCYQKFGTVAQQNGFGIRNSSTQLTQLTKSGTAAIALATAEFFKALGA
jgi:hypothetical protein